MPLRPDLGSLRVSAAMPYTWFIRVPGLSIFREADRLALLGLVGAALLAGAAVDWLRRHRAWPLILAVAVLGAGEAGWSGTPGGLRRCLPRWLPWMPRSPPTIPARSSWMCPSAWTTSRPTAKSPSPRPSSSRPPTATPGRSATRPGCPPKTIAEIERHPFYAQLNQAQQGWKRTQAQIASARADLRTLNVGWVLVWLPSPSPALSHYLSATGFSFAYREDGASVYRPASR